MDRLSDEIRREPPRTMLFADDVVSRKEVETESETWRSALKTRVLKVSRTKTKYLSLSIDDGETVRLLGQETATVDEFRSLGSIVQSNGDCRREMKRRAQDGWKS